MSIEGTTLNGYDETISEGIIFKHFPEQSIKDMCTKTFMIANVILASASLIRCTAGRHKAIYEVHWSHDGTFLGEKHYAGDLWRYLCEYHGCHYEYHHYLKASMPPDCYVIRIKY